MPGLTIRILQIFTIRKDCPPRLSGQINEDYKKKRLILEDSLFFLGERNKE
jgi:hypothetical protein